MTEIDRVSGDLVGVDDLLESTQDETAARRRRRWGWIAVQVSLGLLALLIFGAAGLLWNVTNSVTRSVHTVPVAALPPAPATTAGRPMTVLLLGSDLRVGTDATDGVAGQRADAIMLVRFSPDRSRIDVLSIPRDSWVTIPGKGTAKINASLAGGPSLVVQTVHALTGIQIDHVMMMDFGGVRDLTTALGGVTVINERATTDPRNGAHFDAGPLTLSGNRALAFVRQRYGLPNGDFDRIAHQQQFGRGHRAEGEAGGPARQSAAGEEHGADRGEQPDRGRRHDTHPDDAGAGRHRVDATAGRPLLHGAVGRLRRVVRRPGLRAAGHGQVRGGLPGHADGPADSAEGHADQAAMTAVFF
ncbi:MAG TPA: LCP family protein [Pseudonocardiaceae bacterium]|nr:LCP family protein [Pseudonocardiaceae bacterium]